MKNPNVHLCETKTEPNGSVLGKARSWVQLKMAALLFYKPEAVKSVAPYAPLQTWEARYSGLDTAALPEGASIPPWEPQGRGRTGLRRVTGPLSCEYSQSPPARLAFVQMPKSVHEQPE